MTLYERLPRLVVGVDLGGTKIAAAVVQEDGGIWHQMRRATHAEEGPDRVIGRIASLVKALTRWAEQAGGDVAAVGIGAPAPLSPSRGIIWEAPNMPGWERVALRDLLMERLALPVAVENDGRAAALAEHRLGAGRGANDMLYVTVGTGVGGALIIGGRLHRGATETAGEIGHMVMDPDGPLCGCGRHGCLESLAAGPAIARRAGELLRGGAASSLQTKDPDGLTGEIVAKAARAGDAVAKQAFIEAGRWLGFAIASVANLVNPSVVVVGGGVAQTGDLLMRPLREAAFERALERAAEGLRIERAKLGNGAGMVGAALAAYELPDLAAG